VSAWPRRISLLIGGMLSAGAALWCLAGAGIYGSPLVGMRAEELILVFIFLLIGPFSALPAAIVGRQQPKLAGTWLILGGLISGGVAVNFFWTDAGIFPLLLVSLPMVLLGRWLLATAGKV
jgi:hypothetical protein